MFLRDRNRRAAMGRIQVVSMGLFEERGFDNVTIQEIAEATGVSASTVYRYFGVKEELVVWDENDANVSAAVGHWIGSQTPFDDLAGAFTEGYKLPAEELAHIARRAALIDTVPALLALQVTRLDQNRVSLAEALAKAYRRKKNDLELDLVVRIGLAALLAGFERWTTSKSKRSLSKWIEEAFNAARTGLAS
jgi:AcrR family transcriptional regulator